MAEFAVHQQRPDITERDVLGDQILDVHAAISQRAAILVGFGDLGGEGDDAFESGYEILRNR